METANAYGRYGAYTYGTPMAPRLQEAEVRAAAEGLPALQRLIAGNILAAEGYAAAMHYVDTLREVNNVAES